MKKKFNVLILAILIILSFIVSLLPVFSASIAATIILYDMDWNEVATFHTIVQDDDEVPWWVQYNGDAYAYEYGSGNTYGYMADDDDFTGYWYEGDYIGDIEDLPFPPGYQPPEPDPSLIKIQFIAYYIDSNNQASQLYVSDQYGEPGDPYTFVPLYIPGRTPQYNTYTGTFGLVDSTVYILYTTDVAPGATKQVQLNYIVYDTNSYRTLYSAVINIDQSYENFDTRTVFEHSKYYNASPYINIDYDATVLNFDIYLVNIKDNNHYLQPYIQNQYNYEFSLGESAGDAVGYERGVNDTNPDTLSNFLPKLFGSVASSFYYIASNISIGGIALASVIAVCVIGVIVILVIKLIKR